MKIYKQFDTMSSEHKELFKISVNSNEVMSYSTTISYICSKYGMYNTLDDIEALWTVYATMNVNDLARAYNAFYAEYNPIDNYDGHETYIHMENHGTETNTRTDNTTETNTANNVKNNEKITTFDSTNYRPANETEQTGSTTTANTGTVTNATTHDTTSLALDGTTYSGDTVSIDKRDRHGNMGVTRTQEMILDEIKLRMIPYLQQYIDNFIAQYAFLLLTDCEG